MIIIAVIIAVFIFLAVYEISRLIGIAQSGDIDWTNYEPTNQHEWEQAQKDIKRLQDKYNKNE